MKPKKSNDVKFVPQDRTLLYNRTYHITSLTDAHISMTSLKSAVDQYVLSKLINTSPYDALQLAWVFKVNYEVVESGAIAFTDENTQKAAYETLVQIMQDVCEKAPNGFNCELQIDGIVAEPHWYSIHKLSYDKVHTELKEAIQKLANSIDTVKTAKSNMQTEQGQQEAQAVLDSFELINTRYAAMQVLFNMESLNGGLMNELAYIESENRHVK